MSQHYRPGAGATRQTGTILLALWGILSIGQLAYVVAFTHNQPWADEWEFVPTLTGHESESEFFFQPHNEHRLPLPRAIYLGLWHLTHDFRAGSILQVALFSAVAFRGMRLAAKLRGVPDWADAFFPLSLLHVGHCENLLMGYQICFVLTLALAYAALEFALQEKPSPVVVASIALALTLCGTFGIVLAVILILWVVLLLLKRDSEIIPCLATIAILLFTFAYLGFIAKTYQRPPDHPPFDPKNWAATLQVSGQFLAIGFGIGVGPVWFLVLPGVIFASTFARREFLRARKLGPIALAFGVVLLALAIGVGRGGFGSNMGLWPRYSALGWPLLEVSFFGLLRYRWCPRLLAIGAMIALVPNTIFGVNYGMRHDAWLTAIATDWKRGKSVDEVVDDRLQGTGQESRARRGMPMLHDAQIGPFAGPR